MIEDFDESNLVDYQGYIRDETIDFEEKNNEIEQDESIDDESSEVGWNNEDENKYYSKNNSELNETCIIHEEMDKELMNDELDEEMDEELKNDELDEEMDEEIKNEEVVVEEKKEEEQHAWYYGLKEEIVQEEPNVVYESFTPEKKPLVQEEINIQETNSNNKKCFWGIIWDFINIFSK
jgi:hypothetical protein